MAIALPASAVQEWEACFLPDKFRDLQGPAAVSRDWKRELERIDSRLVLRWQPKWGLYAVFLRVENGARLWPHPVHLIRRDDGGYRPPNSHDLYEVRKANWIARHNGTRAKIDALDRHLAAQERYEAERRDRILRDALRSRVRKHDLTAADFGITRRAWTPGRAPAGLEA